MRFSCLAALPPLLLAACNVSPIQPGDSNAIVDNSEVQPLIPGRQPVRVGESGPQFAACPNRGTVVNLGTREALVIRAAPFAEAEALGELRAGAQMYVCTRSMNQRWLGVVLPPAEGDTTDCGVEARLESARPYSGPCLSGWVTNGFVQLGAR